MSLPMLSMGGETPAAAAEVRVAAEDPETPVPHLNQNNSNRKMQEAQFLKTPVRMHFFHMS